MIDSVVGPVPGTWKLTTIGDLCRTQGGSVQTGPFGSQLHASAYVREGTPTVMPKDIVNNRLSNDTIARVGAGDVARLRRHVLQPGDIVYPRRGDVEKCAYVTDREAGWLCGTGCLRIRPGDGSLALGRFLSLYLRHPQIRSWVTQHAVGATMPNLNTEIIASVPVVLPPLDEQDPIVDVLAALDDKIDVNLRVALAAERLAAVEFAHVADGCDWAALGEVAVHMKSTLGPQTLTGDVDHYSIPAFDRSRLPAIEEASTIKSNKLAVPDKAVLVSRLNPRIPRVWFACVDGERPAMCSTEFLVLEPAGDLTRGALFAACAHPEVLREFAQRAGGTSGSHQRVKPADALSVAVPVLDGGALGETLTALIEAAVQARREAATLAELRDALLPKLLSGEIRVGDAEDLVEGSL